MAKKTICWGCHNSKSMLDYAASKKQGKDVWCQCMGCKGKGYIYEDAEGNRIYKKHEESEEEFTARVETLQ